jgi:hypothetical protein
MSETVRDGEVLGEEERDCWVLKDEISGDEEEFECEPTKAQVMSFKNDCGYTTIKVRKNTACKTIKIRPLDKAGTEDEWVEE